MSKKKGCNNGSWFLFFSGYVLLLSHTLSLSVFLNYVPDNWQGYILYICYIFMNAKMIMFYGLLLAGGTLVSATFAGAWWGAEDLSTLNALTVFKQANILNTWSITIPNISFFLTGARALTSFDFAFFGGSMQILQWFFLMTLGLGFIWGVYTICIYVVSGVFSRR